MADSSLDDFFAKKDKNRKVKKKYSTPDDIAKQLEESGKQTDSNSKSKKDKEKACPANAGVTLKILEQDNDEWKDFEDEREKDYSGLRIQTMNLKDKEDELRDQKLQENSQENKKDDGIGPWKVMTPSPVPDVVPTVENVPVKEDTTTATTTGGRYVPPHLRNKGSSNNLEPVVPGRRTWKSAAPQIDNESEFPTLGNEVSPDSRNVFQPVRQGSRDVPSSYNPPLDIGNKFNLLSSNNRKDDSDSD